MCSSRARTGRVQDIYQPCLQVTTQSATNARSPDFGYIDATLSELSRNREMVQLYKPHECLYKVPSSCMVHYRVPIAIRVQKCGGRRSTCGKFDLGYVSGAYLSKPHFGYVILEMIIYSEQDFPDTAHASTLVLGSTV